MIGRHLVERNCEFVVARPYQLPLPREMQGDPLFADKVRIVVGPKHPFARRRRIGLPDLIDESWILSTNELQTASPIAEHSRAAACRCRRSGSSPGR